MGYWFDDLVVFVTSSAVNLGSDSLVNSFAWIWPEAYYHQFPDSFYSRWRFQQCHKIWMPWLSLFERIFRLFLSLGSLCVLRSRRVLLCSNYKVHLEHLRSPTLALSWPVRSLILLIMLNCSSKWLWSRLTLLFWSHLQYNSSSLS